jgi:hypothetical protein
MELIHEGHNPPNMQIEIYGKLFPPEVGIRIRC